MNHPPTATAPPHQLDSATRPSALTPEDPFPYTAIVEVRMAADDGYRLHPTVQTLVFKHLADRGPIVSQTRDSVRLVFGVTGSTMEAANSDALTTSHDALAMMGLASRSLSRIEIRDAALSEPAPVLVGLVEAATILGVSRQRAAQLAQTPSFPAAIQRLRATPVWLESEVRSYAHERRQRLTPIAR